MDSSSFSQTQSTNLIAFTGVIMLVLNHYKVGIAESDVVATLGAFGTLAGIAMNWYHRFSKGDITLGGFRKY